MKQGSRVGVEYKAILCLLRHTKGIEATKYLLCQSSLSEDTIQLCLDLLTLVLYENYFLAEDTFYIQKYGTAMGSNVTPAYANAFMNHFEISHVFTNDLFICHVLCYHRYIDDIFLVWTGNLDTLLSFHSHLNSILPELQFTIHYNTDSVHFLDTMVLKVLNGGLSTDIYSKPTDCNSLLHYTSCHPRSLKNSLPRSQFNRVARIVSDPGTLNDRLESMAHKFQARCYPSKLLTEEKARTLSPPSPRPPSNAQERIPFVHEFHPLVPKIHFIIRRHWPLLAKAYPNVPTFKEPVLMCNKRAPNIKDKLDGNQGKHRVTKRGPALSNPMFTLVTSEDIAESASHTPIQRCQRDLNDQKMAEAIPTRPAISQQGPDRCSVL
ncbi:unnamed protein product [Ranitomeya imitator]|uniref:Helix-turn-helix domain-containing protein n=1 Tax=Ranitomeya imitator TaxID=111125 RepID=A0ABN9M6Z4_9NEOB|nr:unnamed protein product [Ranitomeya imitator]